jgi:hypothetical protein
VRHFDKFYPGNQPTQKAGTSNGSGFLFSGFGLSLPSGYFGAVNPN